MRNNQPIVNKEVPFDKKGRFIVSRTSPKGVITHVNDYFLEISNYSREDLIGQAHNIVRHPDMPQAAFQLLWGNIMQGEPWMGIVKNRTKDGSFYWVDAFVTPLVDNGQVIAHESVRVKPEVDRVERAQRVYQRLNNQRRPISVSEQLADYLTVSLLAALGLVSALIVYLLNNNEFIGASGCLAVFVCSIVAANAPTRKEAAIAKKVINDPLAQFIYTGNTGPVGAIEFAEIFKAGKLQRSTQYAIMDASDMLSLHVDETNQLSQNTLVRVNEQREHTESTATAIEEMSQSTLEVAKNIQHVSDSTSNIVGQIGDIKSLVDNAVSVIHELSGQIDESQQAINGLAEDSTQIEAMTTDIKSIADQTNLLALNAAIEAARAGESGRGFAVVADEVRALASRTQESTAAINDVISRLKGSTLQAVSLIGKGHALVSVAVERVSSAGESITQITKLVADIESMMFQIATASEEQSTVSSEVSSNVQDIHHLTSELVDQSEKVESHCNQLTGIADNLRAHSQKF